jgi:hypothetical protein
MLCSLRPVLWDGRLDPSCPEGMLSRVYLEALIRERVPVAAVRDRREAVVRDVTPAIAAALRQAEQMGSAEQPRGVIAFRAGYPSDVRDYFWANAPILGAFIVPDYDCVHAGTVQTINGLCDVVACPSEYAACVLRESGVVCPVLVWLPGIEPWANHSRTAAGCFTFGWTGHGEDGGLYIAAEAFRNAFGEGDDVRLLLWNLSAEPPTIPVAFADHRIQYRSSSWQELPMFYASINCLVRPYRHAADGWLELQALADGTQVITTGFGGTLGICNNANALLLDVRGFRKVAAFAAYESKFPRSPLRAEPDMEHLIALMREVAGGGQSSKSPEASPPCAGWPERITTIGQEVDRLERAGVFADASWQERSRVGGQLPRELDCSRGTKGFSADA